ncbi:MAG: response regulator [Chloroflexi bacterium]|nr:response regulator [Chloroflexota bacterium]
MKNTRLLLADDHAVVRSGILNALKDLPNIEIVGEVGNGLDLFVMLASMRPDCLLIDVTMPDFEPISAIAQIHVDYPAMKILVVSAYDDDVYVQGLLGIGVNGYHLKDQPLSDLRLAVTRVLAGERWVSSRIVDKLLQLREPNPNSYGRLTDRQIDLLRLLYRGYDNRKIALALSLSVKTVENHLTRLYKVIGVRSRLEAVNHVMQHPDIIGVSSGATHTPMPSSSPSTLTALIVDDNTRYRQQLMRTISSINPHMLIYEAENTRQAVEMLQHLKPSLALVDVVLGDENGIHCAHQIAVLSPQSRVILISAYPDSEFHRLGLEAGAVAFLDKKTLDTATLRQVVDDC